MSIDRSAPPRRRGWTVTALVATVAMSLVGGTLGGGPATARAAEAARAPVQAKPAGVVALPAETGSAVRWCRTGAVPPPYNYDDLPPCYVDTTRVNFDISTEIGTAIVGSPIDGRIVVTASNNETVKIVVTDESKLPPGVTLSADGKLTGTPTKAGEYTFPIEVCAGQGGAGQACAQTEITVTAGEPQAPEWEVSVEFEGSLGKPSSGSITVTGTPPGETVVITVEDPAKLPPGLTISEDGKITGTPTKAGKYPVPIKICAGDVCMRVVITINIVESSTSTQLEVVIEGFTGYVGHEVTGRFLLKGADYDDVRFTVLDESALPPGVSVSADGTLSGVPTVAGSFTFPVKICKGTACGRTTLTITIEEPPYEGGGTETTEVEVDATVKITEGVRTNLALPLEPGQEVSVVNPYALPPGITVDGAGRITGTATTMGTFDVTLEVTGAGGRETWNVTFEVCACAAGIST